MKKGYKVIEIFDPKGKRAEDKLKEAFILYLSEKLTNNQIKNR